MKRYTTYLRVSTQRQGAEGLGISAQRNMCENFIKQNKGEHIHEFMDVESGTHRDRKGLWQAIEYCKKNECSLVIAKLDRLARDVEFTFKVINTGIDIHFTDMPVVNSMILGVFSAVAQYEREMISSRTKQALAVKKAQGCKLGASNSVYRDNYNKKTWKEKHEEGMKKGATKNARFLESRDVMAFTRALKSVFPDATNGEYHEWDWSQINTRGDSKRKVLSLMMDYKSFDSNLFRTWDFSEITSKKMQVRLASYIQTLRESINKNKKFNQ